MKTLDDYAEEEETTSKVLFRLSDDPFVNEAVAEIARKLGDRVEVKRDRVTLSPEASPEQVGKDIENIVTDALGNTHRRTNTAHQLNAVAEEKNTDIRIEKPQEAFPGDETVFEDDEITAEQLEKFGVDEEMDIGSDAKRAYILSPTFVGRPTDNDFGYAVRDFESHIDTLQKYLTGETSDDENSCLNCGSTGVPSWKADDDFINYTQATALLTTKSGNPTPLGQKSSATSKFRGRCVACLVAGFYYTLMEKAVRLVNFDNGGTYRIFVPIGDLKELVDIRRDLDNLGLDIDAPTDNNKSAQNNIGKSFTESRGVQTLEFFSDILRNVRTGYEGGDDFPEHPLKTVEEINRPTSLISYESSSWKGPQRNRNITSVKSIDADSWVYSVVDKLEVGDEEYYPVEDVIYWFAEIDDRSNNEVGVENKDDMALGIIEKDLGKIERGIFGLLKKVEQDQGDNTDSILPYRKSRKYFDEIMKQITESEATSIGEEDIEKITNVASNLGGMFYHRDDISTLIGFQNANTPAEFLQRFEKAAMQAQKKITEGEEGKAESEWKAISRWSDREDVEHLLKLINDKETFEDTKRMFVIQASLSAHYQNSMKNYRESQEGGEE